MQLLLIAVCVLTLSIQPVFNKQFNLKCQNGQITFSALIVFFALLFFLITGGKINITAQIVPFSIGFALSYSTAVLCNICAIKIGSLSISALVFSYSLIIPTLWGLVFLNEKAGALQYTGIAFLLVSLFLVRQKSKKKSCKKVSGKWILYLIFGFIGNGMCSVLQNEQRRKFSGEQNGNFMVLSLIISFAVLVVIAVITERKFILETIKKGIFQALGSGVCNGATNLLTMLAVAFVPSSVFFPVLSGGQTVLTYLISVFGYKEKFVLRQKIGILFGIAALVLLNI